MDPAVTKRSKKQEIWEALARAEEGLALSRQREAILGERLTAAEGELKTLGEQLKYSVERQKRLTAESERLLLLINLNQDLASLDADRILATTAQKIPHIIGARFCSIYLYDEERKTLVLKDNNHNRALEPLVDLQTATSSLMALAVRTRQTLIVSDLSGFDERSSGDASAKLPPSDRFGARSCLVAPVIHGDTVFGVIDLADRVDGRTFDRADRETIAQAANLIALALANAGRVERLKSATRLDPLTGLRNHSAFIERLDTECKRAQLFRNDLSLIVLDFNAFGWINGNYGYPAGDAVLNQAARLLESQARPIDIVARIGGDDFALLLPEENLNGALETARRIHEIIEDHRFRSGSHSMNVAATLGAAQLMKGQGHAEFLRSAESALNEARRKNEAIGVKT